MDKFKINHLLKNINSLNYVKTVSVECVNEVSLNSNSINIFSMNILSFKAKF